MWKDLTMREKSEVMRMAIDQGISDLNEIRTLYDSSVSNTLNGIEENFYGVKGSEPDRNYTISTQEADSLGYFPDERGHRDDRVKLPSHPTHPSRGTFVGTEYQYSNEGMKDPNYTLWGLRDNGDGDVTPVYQGTKLLPEVTVSPQGNYIHNTYDNVKYYPSPDQVRYAYGGPMGNMYGGKGDRTQQMYVSSPAIRAQIAAWEGESMYKPAPDTGKVNNPFEKEDAAFWATIPKEIRHYLTQEMLDALYSTSYNIGAGNFRARVVPQLKRYFLEGTGSIEEIQKSMYGTRDKEPKMKGLRTRRAAERKMFEDALYKKYPDGFLPQRVPFKNIRINNTFDFQKYLYTPPSKSMQQKTGATGAHFHIGPDKSAKANYHNWVSKYMPDVHFNMPDLSTSADNLVWAPPMQQEFAQQEKIPSEPINPIVVVPPESPVQQETIAQMWDRIFPAQQEDTAPEFSPSLFDQYTALQQSSAKRRTPLKPAVTPQNTPVIEEPGSPYLLFKPYNMAGYGGNLYKDGGTVSKMVSNYVKQKYGDNFVNIDTGLPYIMDRDNIKIIENNYDGITDPQAKESIFKHFAEIEDANFNNYYDQGLLKYKKTPEVTTYGDPHLNLFTYPIGGEAFPFTGHSALFGPDNFKVDKTMEDPNYNLFFNNCADATYRALWDTFQNTFERSTSASHPVRPITLPAVVEYLAKKLPGAKYYPNSIDTFGDKGDRVAIPLTGDYNKTFFNSVYWKDYNGLSLGGNLFDDGGKVTYNTTSGNGYIPPFTVQPEMFFNPEIIALAKGNLAKARRNPELARTIMREIESNGSKGGGEKFVPPLNSVINAFAYPPNPEDTYTEDSSTAQNTFLLDRDLQEKEFLRKGYIKGKEGDYGLVAKAVGKRNFPVFQLEEDRISRDNLIPIGNMDDYFMPYLENELEDPGHYPTAVYMGTDGNFYQKAWDLNDYGGSYGDTASILGDIADSIGNPVVVTTGFQPILYKEGLQLLMNSKVKESSYSRFKPVKNIDSILFNHGILRNIEVFPNGNNRVTSYYK